MAQQPPTSSTSTSIGPASIDLARQVAQSYDDDNQGIPRLIAKHLLTLIQPISSTSIIHDNACGPAIVTSEILSSEPSLTNPPTIFATDIAEPMVTTTQSLISQHGWKTVTASKMDSCNLSSFSDEKFTHSITNLGIFMTSDPDAAAAEVRRTLKSGGGKAATTAWKYHGFLDLMRRISLHIRPDEQLTGVLATPWRSEADIRETFIKAGFKPDKIEVTSREEKLRFEDEQDLIKLMTGKIAAFVVKDWKEEHVKAIPGVVMKVLSEEEWQSRSLGMVAWVVVAEKE